MRVYFNLRWLLYTVLIAIPIGGGVGAYWWWVNRPDYLLESGTKYHQRAEAIPEEGDQAAKRSNLEYADQQLRNLLSPAKAPTDNRRHAQAYMIRHKVLLGLVKFYAADEEQQGDASHRRSNEVERDAWVCAYRAAELDPKNAEAQSSVMMRCLRTDQILRAEPYATKILQIKQGENSDGEWPSYAAHQAAAGFVSAWVDVHQRAVPQPKEALQNVRLAEDMERRDWEQQAAKNGTAGAVPPPARWRLVALEAQSLATMADAGKPQAPLALKPTIKESESSAAAEQLRQKAPQWVARIRTELELPPPPKGVTIIPPTVASMTVMPSPTDIPAVLDVLMISINLATTPKEVLERTDLLLTVSEKLSARQPPDLFVIREVCQRVALLPEVVQKRTNYLVRIEKQNTPNLPRSSVWKSLCERIDKFGEMAMETGTRTDPDAYLRLARNASKEGRRDSALKYSLKGLETIERTKAALPANIDPSAKQDLERIESGLNSLAAWLYITARNFESADKHLTALRQTNNKAYLADANLLEGLSSIHEGRLEKGVRELEQARASTAYGDTIFPYVGLAIGYTGLGKYDKALVNLERIQHYFQKFDKLTDEEKSIAEQLIPNVTNLNLEFVRSHLALGNMQQAFAYRELLKDVPEGQVAGLLLVGHYLKQANSADPEVRLAAYQAAQKEIDRGRKVNPKDLRFVWAQVAVLLHRPQANVAAIAGGIAALSIPAASVGDQLVGNLLLRKGIQWNVEQAERLLWKVGNEPKNLEARLAWVRWLVVRGRFQEANDLLTRLEEVEFPSQKRAMQIYRAEIMLSARDLGEASKILQSLESAKQDIKSDILSAKLYALMGGAVLSQAQEKIKSALSRHEERGQVFYMQGRLSEAQGDFRQAVKAYERAAQFLVFRPASQRGMLTGLMGLARAESPGAAFNLSSELLRSNPTDPALLLSFAECAIMMDAIYGEQGMEGALKALDATLRENGDAVSGPYFAARGWNLAGRPDMARKEVVRALEANPRHRDSLVLAGQLALTSEDWTGALHFADALEAADANNPEALRWRALAYDNLNRTADAQKAYYTLVNRFPHISYGYHGLAAMLDRAKDYAGALRWAKAWREKNPNDLAGLEYNIRLLILANRAPEANALGEQAVRDYMKVTEASARAQLREQERKLPAEEFKKRAAESEQRLQQFLAGQECAVTLAIAGAFRGAMKFDDAEAWTMRSIAMAEKTPEPTRADLLLNANLALGELYLFRGQYEMWPWLRSKELKKAIEIYQGVYEKAPGHLIAGNNLAWLLVVERGETEAAFGIAERIRTGRWSQKMIGAERLPLELLDTIGVIYRESQHHEDAIKLFREASRRYADEPRVYLHLGRSYAGVRGYRSAAIESLSKAVRLAAEKAENVVDPKRKAQLVEIMEEARKEQQDLLASR